METKNLPYGDEPVPYSYSAAWIIFSYVVSLIGTWTTVELLHRQTSMRGLYNWFLMLGASVAMGAVAIWSMHFIGNQAIVMGDGSQAMRLSYSSAYTAISFVLPIIVVASSFLVFSLSYYPNWWNISAGGILAGAAIVGMHYVGEIGISNYQAKFDPPSVVGACLIAVTAATTALGLFFRLKSRWSSAAWRRMLCAALLAIAVSSMHWVAVAGTSYRIKQGFEQQHGVSTATAGWICGVLAMVCCLMLITLMIFWQRYIYQSHQKAQEVNLAICVFDQEGRLMMNPAGMIPSSRITKAHFDDVWDEELQPGHPVFCWMYRVSCNWKCCSELIPRMRSHIASLKQTGTLEAENRGATSYTKIFREQFCVAAADLALRLDQPIDNIGVLYDRILTTGTYKQNWKQILAPFSTASPRGSIGDIESIASRCSPRGQTLYLVKHASRQECGQLQASGYAFAPMHDVVENLARNSQTEVNELSPHLQNMFRHRPSFQVLEPGVHISVFCVKPNMYSGFDVLVDKCSTNLLPTTRLQSTERVERWHQDIVTEFSGLKARNLLEKLSEQAGDISKSLEQRQFLSEFLLAMHSTSNRVGAELFANTVLTSTTYEGPCATRRDGDGNLIKAHMYVFRSVTDLHFSQPADSADEYIPFRLFAARQRVYPNSLDHATFASLVHQEFSGVESHRSEDVPREQYHSALLAPKLGRKFRDRFGIGLAKLSDNESRPMSKYPVGDLGTKTSDNSSEKGLVHDAGPSPFGGILVSNQVSVSVTERDDDSAIGMELSALPATNAVEVAASSKEKDTFADELLVAALRDHVMHQRQIQHRNTTKP